MPEPLADPRTVRLLKGTCQLDLDVLDVELLRGFGVTERPAHDAQAGIMENLT